MLESKTNTLRNEPKTRLNLQKITDHICKSHQQILQFNRNLQLLTQEMSNTKLKSDYTLFN